jgi:DNA-binding CsgD family transcriptional regulator
MSTPLTPSQTAAVSAFLDTGAAAAPAAPAPVSLPALTDNEQAIYDLMKEGRDTLTALRAMGLTREQRQALIRNVRARLEQEQGG